MRKPSLKGLKNKVVSKAEGTLEALGGSDGKLKKLTIKSYAEPELNISTATYQALINPETIEVKYNLNFSQEIPLGVSGPDLKFTNSGTQTISFNLMIDSTINSSLYGLISESTPETEVKENIETLKSIVYNNSEGKSEPPYVLIAWDDTFLKNGDSDFGGKLESMNIKYLLFSPSGNPIRAEVALSFVGTVSPLTEVSSRKYKATDGYSSLEVQGNESLDQIAQKHYGNSKPETIDAICKANNMGSMRETLPGQKLILPPATAI